MFVVSVCSLFIGVMDADLASLMQGDPEVIRLFLISRIPRLLAILCTGIGMSTAGLIMQQLCMNKFVSPTTGATISSAQLGILLALVFLPESTLLGRAVFAFVAAILGTWIFVWFVQKIRFKDVVLVPLVGIMFGNVIGGITSFIAYQYEMNQALSTWLVGHFSMVLRGRYEIVYLTVPLVVLAFVFANHFNIVGIGKEFSQNLGVPYNLVLFMGLTIAAMITASVVVVVGSISYIGLIVPNIVTMFKGGRYGAVWRFVRYRMRHDLESGDCPLRAAYRTDRRNSRQHPVCRTVAVSTEKRRKKNTSGERRQTGCTVQFIRQTAESFLF